ncbi:alpha/beta fold hydrolase [Roseospira visakhapatnamensis]|uniref:Pimeloyl-ACP methyl ester carboxylesterase n=1 Tax=Roseospira visakhapatnamensis TaxID=390880 RepID=A0A7W6RB40_9PROT|nr:alpha/beta hydrolase [Roseospira visakhapatnamensis]MBB4265092.1 pimeloyl-ACP methyl ester carboxylesterase [Roseospira visakhapatnamensis]
MSKAEDPAVVVRHVLCARREGLKRMSYRQQGPAHAPQGQEGAPSIICVHGLTRNAHDFDALGAALAATGRRVLAADVLGRGASDWLADPMGYAVPGYVGDMMGLIGRATSSPRQDQVDWVGTSMGGLIGLVLAASPISPIRRLVLNDVGPFLPQAALERIAAYVTAEAPVFDSLEAAEAHYREIHADFGPMTDDDWTALTRHSTVRTEDGAGWRPHQDPAIGAPAAAMPAHDMDLWDVWDQIACPVLVVRGARSDLLTPDVAEEMGRRGPGCTVHTVTGAGHAPTFTTPEINRVVVDFLAG